MTLGNRVGLAREPGCVANRGDPSTGSRSQLVAVSLIFLERQAAITIKLAADVIQLIVGVSEGIGQPVWRPIDQIYGLTVDDVEDEFGSCTGDGAVVVDGDVVQFGPKLGAGSSARPCRSRGSFRVAQSGRRPRRAR